MKRIIFITTIAVIVVVMILACRAEAESTEVLARTETKVSPKQIELETVSLSYEDYLDTKASYEQVNEPASSAVLEETEAVTETEKQVNTMNVWELGSYLYDIPEYDTTRSLVLITYEGYGPDSPLSYYVACCCWVRATENYLGFDNLYTSFGGADTWNYGEWLDNYGYAEYAVEVLRQCYLNPTYVVNCNGMEVPDSYIYEENGIYVW